MSDVSPARPRAGLQPLTAPPLPSPPAYICSNQIMGWGEKAIEIRSVETGHLDGVFMHKRAQRLKFLCERNDKVGTGALPGAELGQGSSWVCLHAGFRGAPCAVSLPSPCLQSGERRRPTPAAEARLPPPFPSSPAFRRGGGGHPGEAPLQLLSLPSSRLTETRSPLHVPRVSR